MESGYISIELQQVSLVLTKITGSELRTRLDVEIISSSDSLTWTNNGEKKYSTPQFNPSMQTSGEEKGENQEEPLSFMYGFNQLLLRFNYLDLTNEIMNEVANTQLSIKITSIGDMPAPTTSKPAKGAPPPPTEPPEDVLIDICLPLSTLLLAKNCFVDVYETVQNIGTDATDSCIVSTHESVVTDSSSLIFKVYSDNNLAEYVLGAKLMRWESATLSSPPVSWCLDAPDVVNPKAKVQPTAADLRAEYLVNIQKVLAAQSSTVQYSLGVGGGDEAENPFSEFFPELSLQNGKIVFAAEAAVEVPADENIRVRTDLWKVIWDNSPTIFLQRNVVRKLLREMQQETNVSVLPLVVSKKSLSDAASSDLSATAWLDISGLLTPGAQRVSFEVKLEGEGIEDAGSTLEIFATESTPFVPLSALERLSQTSEPKNPAAVLTGKQVSKVDRNRDLLQDLRNDICLTIERISQEYLSLYPTGGNQPTSGTNSRNVSKPGTPMRGGDSGGGLTPSRGASLVAFNAEERQAEFLNYILTHGLFHEFKENLKPRVQELIQDHYGGRGRALGKSAVMAEKDLGDNEALTDKTLEEVLSELYVFLLKQCSIVLNSMFSDTLIDRSKKELELHPMVDDQMETEEQKLKLLLMHAEDAAADERFDDSEAVHLERIQFVNHSVAMGSNAEYINEVYATYAKLLLRWRTNVLCFKSSLHSLNTGETQTKASSLLQKAREALVTAYNSKPTDNDVGLLLACVLVESGQQEQAEETLHQVMGCQLNRVYRKKDLPFTFEMQSFQEFDGYESDKLVPVDPRCYAILATLFSMQQTPLKARKALLLANRSFSEGDYQPPISTHGSPRRTMVLVLAEACVFFFSHSFKSLGLECVKLADQSEEAVTAKANARGKPATTVPHIKHLLKRSHSLALQFPSAEDSRAEESYVEALEAAKQSQMVADNLVDEVRGWLCVGDALLSRKQATSSSTVGLSPRGLATAEATTTSVLEAYLNAVHCAKNVPLEQMKGEQVIPLSVFVLLGRLMLSAGKLNEALNVLIYGCSVYSSSCLFLLLGVCCLRLDQLDDAEDALVEANVLDFRNSEIWAYLCLTCLAWGPHRLEEAEKALFQALRLGLKNAGILRELATSFMSIDKLQVAEDLIRRALREENKEYEQENKKPNPRTRKLLGDILAGQNQAAKAVDAYQRTIADEFVDVETKMEAGSKCCDLLMSLGREEELKTLREIMASLSGNYDATSPKKMIM